ncbi:hypothetical protein ACUXAV_000170 [Cupriavidus metallidurans]|jgi:hypothetical protein|uniref:hypothetical protein n=1 Tax=Cupriavidus TaxID=106589 RepID=UPI0007997BBF|nr:hypothetical protein [Cupriavidus metallidurans]KWW37913.1 hypothetical protein AU374_01692 [Cupriavidus metallidurans]MDE4918135.1 hypothetical protein [Cupriavidus metallidurans]
MNAFLVCIVSHDGVRIEFTAIARTRLDAQLGALNHLTAPPRFCCAHAIGRAT